MKQNKLQTSETGIAHIGLILLASLVLGVASFAVSRAMSNNDGSSSSQSASSEPEDSDKDDASAEADADKEAKASLEQENAE